MNRAKKIDAAMISHGLGRLAAHDPKDQAHLMAPLVRPSFAESRFWVPGSVLDQGPTSQCVAYSWAGFILSSPIHHKPSYLPTKFEEQLYHQAQTLDEFPGEDYEGTSVRAGAKALVSQGLIGEYLWAFDSDTLRKFILSRGPAVIGINWYEEMFVPDENGYLILGGDLAGGHAILVTGYSNLRQAFRLQNSWGHSWGDKGRCWLHAADMDRLFHEAAEACSAMESKV